jgi:hypothetical protein
MKTDDKLKQVKVYRIMVEYYNKELIHKIIDVVLKKDKHECFVRRNISDKKIVVGIKDVIRSYFNDNHHVDVDVDVEIENKNVLLMTIQGMQFRLRNVIR